MLAGAHRVQRVPEGETRRHTSFATVAVLMKAPVDGPDLSGVVEQTYRGSGPGGQHRNTSDTAVRLIHPSGLVVTASEDRSQWRNRQVAWDRLRAALAAAEGETARAAQQAERAQQAGTGERREATWTWCGWRDEVTSPAGRGRMSRALRGRLPLA